MLLIAVAYSFSYVYQSDTFQGIANSILKGKGGKKEASKEAAQ